MSDFSKPENDGEEITFIKKSHGTLGEKTPIEIGTEKDMGHPKSFVNVTINKEGLTRNANDFVVKEFESKDIAFWEIDKCLNLKAAGVPVPTTHRYIYDNLHKKHLILYTDFTQGGKDKVWSKSNELEDLEKMHISGAELAVLQSNIEEIAQKAAEAGYILHPDSYFIIRKQNGNLEITVGDLGLGIFESTKEGAQKANLPYAREFIGGLSQIHK